MNQGPDARGRLESLHIALEAALEQLLYAQQIAAHGSELGAPADEVLAIERLLGELTGLRNSVRERLVKLMGRPSLPIVK